MDQEWLARGGPHDGHPLGPPVPGAKTITLYAPRQAPATYRVNRSARRYDYVWPFTAVDPGDLVDFRTWSPDD
jgi:hypothetical protein